MDVDSWTPATWSALAAWTTVLVLAVTAVIALRQAREARRSREQQFRPFVIVDLVVRDAWAVDLLIENVGKTAAFDVTFRFHPPMERALDDKPTSRVTFAESSLMKRGIPTLPPGKTIRTLFDSFIERTDRDMPLVYEARVTYRGFDGKAFDDEYTIDLGVYQGLLFERPKGVAEIANSIDDIHKEIRKWTRSPRGLAVYETKKSRADRSARRWGRLDPLEKDASLAAKWRRKVHVRALRLADRLGF